MKIGDTDLRLAVAQLLSERERIDRTVEAVADHFLKIAEIDFDRQRPEAKAALDAFGPLVDEVSNCFTPGMWGSPNLMEAGRALYVTAQGLLQEAAARAEAAVEADRQRRRQEAEADRQRAADAAEAARIRRLLSLPEGA